jgi:hypothetical protein
MNKLTSICRNMNIHIGIITVPASQAQGVCDALVDSGVLAIWNFAPVHLNTPEGILVQNENMAARRLRCFPSIFPSVSATNTEQKRFPAHSALRALFFFRFLFAG